MVVKAVICFGILPNNQISADSIYIEILLTSAIFKICSKFALNLTEPLRKIATVFNSTIIEINYDM